MVYSIRYDSSRETPQTPRIFDPKPIASSGRPSGHQLTREKNPHPLVNCLEDPIGHQLKAPLEHEGSTHGGEDEGGRPPEDVLVDFPDNAGHGGWRGKPDRRPMATWRGEATAIPGKWRRRGGLAGLCRGKIYMYFVFLGGDAFYLEWGFTEVLFVRLMFRWIGLIFAIARNEVLDAQNIDIRWKSLVFHLSSEFSRHPFQHWTC